MSKLKTHGRPDTGFWVMQHQGYDLQGFDLIQRAGQQCVRVTGRMDTEDGLGHWIEDHDYRADWLGSNFWLADFQQRKVSGHSFGWGARVVKGGGAKGVATGGKGKKLSTALLPVYDDRYTLDNRFRTKTISELDKASWGKHPVGTIGIVHTGTYERDQTDIFFPCDSRLVAANFDGDYEMGSIVYDLNEDGEYDKDRGARLQSAFRVLKVPLGLKNNAIALQLGQSGLLDTQGGYFSDFRKGKLYVGQGNYTETGPFYCGDEKDSHNHGKDADGNPVGALHWKHTFLLHKDNTEDGPLKIETYQPPDADLNHRVPVHFGFDQTAKDWGWWTTSALYVPTLDPKPLPLPQPKPLEFAPFDPTRPPVPTLDRTPGLIPQDSLTTAFNIVAMLTALATPAIVYRPQNYSAGQINTGLFPDLFENPKPAGGATDAAKKQKKADNNPITLGTSAFGAQGGQIGTYPTGTYTGGEGDPWVFTSVPKGTVSAGKQTSKYIGGTASGGIVYHPPETDLRDVASYGMVPPNVSLSTCYVDVGPGAFFSAGIPELVNGRIKDGFSWGWDSATGDLIYRSHVSSGAPSNAVRFNVATQNVSWYSNTSFQGILDHANTADRTYTFPNISGTVALTSGSGIFTPGSVIFADAIGELSENNASFLWDNPNVSLRIAQPSLTASDYARLAFPVAGGSAASGEYILKITPDPAIAPGNKNYGMTLKQFGNGFGIRNNTHLKYGYNISRTSTGAEDTTDPGICVAFESYYRPDVGHILTEGYFQYWPIGGGAELTRPFMFNVNNDGSNFMTTYFGSDDYQWKRTSTDALVARMIAANYAWEYYDSSVLTRIVIDAANSQVRTSVNGSFSAALTKSFHVEGTSPGLSAYDTAAGSNAKTWDFYANGGQWNFRTVNDAGSAATNILNVYRSGAVPTSVVLNEDGADCDTRIEGDTNTSLTWWDAGLDKVGFLSQPVTGFGVVQVYDTSTYTNENTGLSIVNASTSPNKLINLGYDATLDSGFIYSVHSGTAIKPFTINCTNLVHQTSTSVINRLSGTATTESVFNEQQADIDHRFEGDSISHMLFLDATATTENIALVTTAAPNWQTMDRGLFLGDTSNAPSGNPSAGIFIWSEGGAGKARGGGGTVTTWAPSEPHCPKCGYDYIHEWENVKYKQQYLAVCMKCLTDEIGDRPWILRKKVSVGR